jgi:hypothetical protein
MQTPKLANDAPKSGIHAYLNVSATNSQCFRGTEAQVVNHTTILKKNSNN